MFHISWQWGVGPWTQCTHTIYAIPRPHRWDVEYLLWVFLRATVIKQVKVEIGMLVGDPVVSFKQWVIWSYSESMTVTSHGRHGVSNQGQLDHLFNSLFKLAVKKTPTFRITCPLWGESMDDPWFPSQRTNNADSVYHAVTSSWSRWVDVRPKKQRSRELTVGIYHGYQ